MEEIISQLGVQIIKKFKKDTKIGNAFIYGVLNRRDVLVKIISNNDVKKSANIHKEAIIANLIERNNKDLKKPLIFHTSVLGTGQNKDYTWLIRRYYKGRSLSEINEKIFLSGNDRIQIIFQDKKKDVIDQIVKNSEAIASLKSDSKRTGFKRGLFAKRFFEKILDYKVGDIEKGLKIDLSGQVDYFIKHQKKYYESKNLCFITGDLIPSNIIIKDDGKVVFSDLEWFCLDNQMMDYALLWLFFWRYPDWQSYLLKQIIKNKDDRIFFRLSIIRIIIGWYSYVYNLEREETDVLRERRANYQKLIWTKYLIAAGESFESILKVKC